MTDAASDLNADLVERFAALVALAIERPGEAGEQREAIRGVIEAAKRGAVTFTLQDGALRADGSPVEAPVLARRFAAYGVEELGLTPRVSQADLFDLVRLLASPPGDGDPVARFTAQAAVIDAKAIPRRLRPRLVPLVEPELRPAQPRASRQTPAVAPSVAPVNPPPAVVEAPAVPVASPAPVSAPIEPPAVPRDAPVRLTQPLAIPKATNPALASAMLVLEHADSPKRLSTALEQMVGFCDLAFRQGRHDDLIEGVAALIAIEFRQLERDASDEQRQAFNHAIRRLARPVVLRQLATLRHRRVDDPVATERLQQALFRFGTDGAEAVVDECIAAATPQAFAILLECLRGLPRAHEALRPLETDANESVVRQAVAILGALRDEPSEAALERLLDHPDARTRRDVVAALSRFEGEAAFASLAMALGDESPLVRVRAVNGFAARREPRLLALLEPILRTETEREVLFAAVEALGKVGTPEAVQQLIVIAQGTSTSPLRDTTALRIQACIALVAIRSPVAMAAVQVLRDDRDREVRQASMRLVAHARRRPTSQSNAVIVP